VLKSVFWLTLAINVISSEVHANYACAAAYIVQEQTPNL